MSDTNKSQFKQTLSVVLILLLFLLISVQAWYIFKMEKKLDVLHKQQASTQLPAHESTANEKDAPEDDSTKENNAEELPGVQQTALQENLNVQPAQPQDKNVTPENTTPPDHDETTDTTFGGQTWNPYQEMERIQRNIEHDMDRMFKRRDNYYTNRPAFNNPGFNRPSYNNPRMNKPGFNKPGINNPRSNKHDFHYSFKQSLSTPEMDVKENANQYIVLVNLPGADKSDISVSLDGQRLTVKGKRDDKKQNKDATGNIIFQVRQSGSFQRSITLASPVMQNTMKTRLDNGVLTIIIPKL